MPVAENAFTRILVTGAGGQLGRAFRAAFAGKENPFPEAEFLFTDVQGANPADVSCDLSDHDAIVALLDRFQPDLIINPGAYTAVDRAEAEEALAHAVNAGAPASMASWARVHNATLIHYSTDYVFDGSGNTPWREDDRTGPGSVYGRTKLAGERAVLDSGVRGAIFRTSWVYADEGHNFIKTMLRLGAEKDELRVVADQTGVPTSAEFLADMTLRALGHPSAISGEAMTPAKVYHLVPRGELNWHQFAETILARAREAGLDIRAKKVTPITTADYPTPAKRPLNSRLDCSRFERTFGIKLDDWRVGFEKVMVKLTR